MFSNEELTFTLAFFPVRHKGVLMRKIFSNKGVEAILLLLDNKLSVNNSFDDPPIRTLSLTDKTPAKPHDGKD